MTDKLSDTEVFVTTVTKLKIYKSTAKFTRKEIFTGSSPSLVAIRKELNYKFFFLLCSANKGQSYKPLLEPKLILHE